MHHSRGDLGHLHPIRGENGEEIAKNSADFSPKHDKNHLMNQKPFVRNSRNPIWVIPARSLRFTRGVIEITYFG